MPTYQLTSEVYLDKQNKCYKKIITINTSPDDPILNNIVKTVRREKLSEFQGYGNPCNCYKHCLYAILHPKNLRNFLCLDDIAELFTFLTTNGYTIDTSISKLLLKKNKDIICFITK